MKFRIRREVEIIDFDGGFESPSVEGLSDATKVRKVIKTREIVDVELDSRKNSRIEINEAQIILAIIGILVGLIPLISQF